MRAHCIQYLGEQRQGYRGTNAGMVCVGWAVKFEFDMSNGIVL